MSIARMEEGPVVHPRNLLKEVPDMNQNPSIYTLFGLMILVCLVTFNFLVMAATWMLLRHQDTKGKIAPGINIRDL